MMDYTNLINMSLTLSIIILISISGYLGFRLFKLARKKRIKEVKQPEQPKRPINVSIPYNSYENEGYIEIKQKSEDNKIQDSSPKVQDSSSVVKTEEDIGVIPIENDIKMFKDTYDTDYENAINISALEVSHAHTTHQKQLDIQLAKENRRRLVT